MKELKIGETIDYNSYILEVKRAIDESDPCKGCFFDDFLDCTKGADVIGHCSSLFREDNTAIIFKRNKIMKEVTIKIPDNCELVKEGDVYKIREISYPTSWKEYCKMYPSIKDEYYINFNSQITLCTVSSRDCIDDRNLLSSKEEAEAFLALMQLRQLRKAWVGDWNYEISSQNYIPSIVYVKESGIIITESIHNNVLSFPTKEMAEEFLTCFRDLCETAKILL